MHDLSDWMASLSMLIVVVAIIVSLWSVRRRAVARARGAVVAVVDPEPIEEEEPTLVSARSEDPRPLPACLVCGSRVTRRISSRRPGPVLEFRLECEAGHVVPIVCEAGHASIVRACG